MTEFNIDYYLQAVEEATENMIFKLLGHVFAPIDINFILDKLNINVSETNLDSNAIGKITIEQSNAEIVLNKKELNICKKRFTLAHELGHWHLYHLENKTDLVTEYSNHKQTSIKEIYANRFATSILVPRRIFKNILQSTRDIPTLAQVFQVPENAIKYRIISIYGQETLTTLGWS